MTAVASLQPFEKRGSILLPRQIQEFNFANFVLQMKVRNILIQLLWIALLTRTCLGNAGGQKLLDVETGTSADAYPRLTSFGGAGYIGEILSDDLEKETLRDEVWGRLETLGKVSAETGDVDVRQSVPTLAPCCDQIGRKQGRKQATSLGMNWFV
jgi:hypothetical protein